MFDFLEEVFIFLLLRKKRKEKKIAIGHAGKFLNSVLQVIKIVNQTDVFSVSGFPLPPSTICPTVSLCPPLLITFCNRGTVGLGKGRQRKREFKSTKSLGRLTAIGWSSVLYGGILSLIWYTLQTDRLKNFPAKAPSHYSVELSEPKEGPEFPQTQQDLKGPLC